MPTYKAPIEEIQFVLFDFLKASQYQNLRGFEQLTPDIVGPVLNGAATICEKVLQPLNQVGDELGCRFENGAVHTPDGFRAAYQAFCEGGWNRISVPESAGGLGLPQILSVAMSEMSTSANQALSMYIGLSMAARGALMAFADPQIRQHYLPKLVSGEWCGTMNLTEPHSGTDLKLMKTRAVPQADGTYRLSGTKIFISGGDHDMVENIVHMVIAKVPDADGRLRDDLSTVGFFMVPKFLVNPDGSLGARNGVHCIGIEKKMGIKGSATCILQYEDAVAYAIGPRPGETKSADAAKAQRSTGMTGMFAMMNAARLGVGLQGIALTEAAYQNAVIYANERLQGRSVTGPKAPDKPADPIIVHPDIRRMLLGIRSFLEAGRGFVYWVSLQLTLARSEPDAERRARAEGFGNLMTPVVKAYVTDMAVESISAALQCFGGHGYIRDHGMEQFLRDARILPIYEGANGIQGLDLVARKLPAKGGEAMRNYLQLLDETITSAGGDETLKPLAAALSRGTGRLREATLWLMQNGMKNPEDAAGSASDYLRLFGIVTLGWVWLGQARAAHEALADATGERRARLETKLVLADHWMERVMPDTAALLERVRAGSRTLMRLPAAAF